MSGYKPLTDCSSTRLHRLVRIVDDIYRKHLHDTGLTESQVSILLTLASEGPLLQAQLGKVLHLQRSTVTRNLDRLVKSGLLQKQGPASKPEILLTKQGKTLVKKVRPAWEAALLELKDLLGSAGDSAIGILERRLIPD